MGWYWAFWLIIGFGVPEGYGLITRRTDATLSGNVWKWFDVVPGDTLTEWKFLHFVLAALMVWLTCHFVFGIWR